MEDNKDEVQQMEPVFDINKLDQRDAELTRMSGNLSDKFFEDLKKEYGDPEKKTEGMNTYAFILTMTIFVITLLLVSKI